MIIGKEINQLNGLKGIACIGVFVGHFSGIWKYADSNYIRNRQLVNLAQIYFPVIFDESIWLLLFCIVSGFVISLKEIESIHDLIRAVVKRFLRFYLLILGACFIIYILSKCIGFHNDETNALFANPWFQKDYKYGLIFIDIFKEPLLVIFLGRSIFNSSYWMIDKLFYSSILIYICKYLVKKKLKAKYVIYVITFIGCFKLGDSIGLSIALGMLMGMNYKYLKICTDRARRWGMGWGGAAIVIGANTHAILSSLVVTRIDYMGGGVIILQMEGVLHSSFLCGSVIDPPNAKYFF